MLQAASLQQLMKGKARVGLGFVDWWLLLIGLAGLMDMLWILPWHP